YRLLQPALREYAGRPAWVCRGRGGRRVVAYRELHDAALTLAARMREAGLRGGDTVGIVAPNGPEFTAAALAAWKIGAHIAPIHIGHSAFESAQQLKAVAPRLLLTHESAVDYAPALAICMRADAALAAAETARADGDNGDAGGVTGDSAIDKTDAGATDTVATDTVATAAAATNAAATDAAATADQLAARIYTSGSTGTPKVVRLSHANLASNLRAACRIGDFSAADRFISLLPFSHAMGLLGNLILPLYNGAVIVSPRALAADEILATLREENISVLIAVPRLFRAIMHGMERKFEAGGAAAALYRAALKRVPRALRRQLNAPIRRQLGGRINAWVSGGSHLDARITRYFHALGLPLRQGYGLTETAPLVSMQDDFDAAPDSVGRPVDGVRIQIHRPDARGCGEVWVAGPNVMRGYEDAAQNAEAMRGEWFRTGDIGRVDAAGRLFLTGRSKRLIVTEAGKNVYPEELETLLERDPAVAEAGVLEVGARPVCVLAMAGAGDGGGDGAGAGDGGGDGGSDGGDGDGGDDATVAAARAAVAAFNRLVSSHNRISRFAVVGELPRTPLGKVALRELPAVFARHEVK
ncbi:MAG: class I adenylate-forming enzyme family protein, partial [Gammaproteobacteria bacterium]|nr:class I adenylate-forming enzyme family protein [Gammaproteobacteria bacterium]